MGGLMQDNPYILGFTSGELSPWLSSRFDLQAYQRGAALLQNFMVQPYGGLRRRCGTEYVAEAAVQGSEAIRLMPFCFSEEDSLMLEFFPGGMRVYKNGSLLGNGDGSPYVLETPWKTEQMVLSMRCMQVNDVVYVTTPYYEPIMLKRYGNTDWQCSQISFEPAPRETYLQQSAGLKVQMETNGRYALLETDLAAPEFTPAMENKEYVIAEMEVPTRTLFLNESFSFATYALPDLSATDVGASRVYTQQNAASGMYDFYYAYNNYYKMYYNGSALASSYPNFFMPGVMRLDAANENRPYEINGGWELYTNGEWDASWEIWRSYDNFSTTMRFYNWQWSRVRSFDQNAFSERKNWALSGTEDTPCRMVLVCRSAKSASLGAHLHFRILGGTREYKFKIISCQSAHQARALLLSVYMDGCKSFYTRKWSYGAFGARNGYPGFSSLHQGRLWFGGVSGMPTTLFASASGDFQNFRMGSNDDDALHLTLAADDQSRICWICPSRSLLVGTTESEWTLAAPDGGAITPSNASFCRQSSVGSEVKDATGVENAVFYIQRGGRRLREISYKLEADGYTSTDVSLLAEHLFHAGVRDWAVQRGSSARMWVLMEDYTLAVLTTNVEQKVTAWQRVSFPGRQVLRIATLARMGSNEDELWLVMRHEGGGYVSVERIVSDNVFLDAIGTATPETAHVQGGMHLAGLPGLVYPQGQPGKARPIAFGADGSFTIPEWEKGTTYCYGIPYRSELQTMPQENERSYNAVRQEGRVKLRLLQSDPAFHYRASHAEKWETYDPGRDKRAYPYTGAIRISHIPSPATGQGFCLYVDGATDFQLLSLTIEFDFHGH